MTSRATAARAAPSPIVMVFVSLLLHGILIVGLFVTFSKKLDFPLDSTPVVPVDLVTVADQTNIAPTRAPEPVAPPEPQMLEPAPQDVVAPKIEISPDTKPVPKKEESNRDRFAALLDKLTTQPPDNAKVARRSVQGAGAQTAMTADLVSILASEIYRCWSPPNVGPRPERLVVFYNVHLNQDGTVAEAEATPESQSAAARDGYMQAAVDAAGRAIHACSPYRLPPERYREWSNFTFRFNPADVIGQ